MSGRLAPVTEFRPTSGPSRTTASSTFSAGDTITLARIIGGNMHVDRPEHGTRSVMFSLFGGKLLEPGWTVEEVRLRGATWKKHPEGDDPSIRVEVTAYANRSASARVESLILRGPAGQPWSAAFTGRRTWTLDGDEAWEIARTYGYEFHPIVEHEWEALEGGTGGWDSKVVHEAVAQETRTRCRTLASVELGRMRAKCVSAPAGSRLITERDRSRDFRMFAGKALASGWTVRDIEAIGVSWVEHPSQGASSLESVYRLTMRLDDPGASGHFWRIVLEGPAGAESWRDAFRVN